MNERHFFSSQVTWYRDGKDLTNDTHYAIVYASGCASLEVQCARVEDTGRYLCRAINDLGEQETSSRVVVEGELLTYFNIYKYILSIDLF